MNWTRSQAWRFIRPDWRISVATVVFCGLTLVAANWQQNRAAEKEALQKRLEERSTSAAVQMTSVLVDPADYDQRQIHVRGTYAPQQAVFVDNKIYRGKAGYHVFVPLKIADSDTYVLINRGWVAQGATRSELPQVATPPGPREIQGVAVVPSTRYMELGSNVDSGALRQNLSLEKFARQTGMRLQPVIIEQRDDSEDGLVRDWPRPDFGIEKHRIYALQWYSFCGLAIFLYVFLHIRRPKTQA